MTARTEAWVKAHLGPSATLAEPLTGGITSAVRSVRTAKGSFVLKQVTNREWLDERPDVVHYEARVLDYLANDTGIPVPEVIAVDAHGEKAGAPSMILSWIDAQPAGNVEEPDDILGALAETVLTIGAIEAPDWVRPFARYLEPGEASPPHWSRVRNVWEAAIAAISTEEPPSARRFIHRDFHHWNVLWRDEVTGVVDWSQASIGPTAMDVAHCRMNLAVQWSVAVADRFRDIFESLAGVGHEPYFDIVTLVDLLPDWRSREREDRILDGYLEDLVRQL